MDSFGILLSIYDLERQIFRRMLMIGMEAEVSSRVIGFWLTLESIGHPNVVRKIATQNNMTLSLAAAEAIAALAQIESNETTNSYNAYLPLISYTADHSFTLDHFYLNRHVFRDNLYPVIDGICNVIFRDIWENGSGQAPNRLQFIGRVRPSQEGSSQQGAAAPMGGPPITAITGLIPRSNLNPMAQSWTPEVGPSHLPAQFRTLFVTFSIGYSLTENEIFNFFTGVFGDCIETIYVNHPRQGEGPSLFGKVVFRSTSTIEYVMNGEEVVKLIAAGKPLWCRRFDPRSQGRWRRRSNN
ncbi:hypothetical protein NE237_027778 [Protea cynaroides]|uniref:RRM domain-containing protein n=1 Tax=Protea cynaroides TaxID=273540 RepID=A0A9Q0GN51_9MAGN|nr:hypothetical protein NE237_027778 [Protea cynaroides]